MDLEPNKNVPKRFSRCDRITPAELESFEVDSETVSKID